MIADVVIPWTRPMRLTMLHCTDKVTNYHATMLQAVFSAVTTCI